jgi:hypothetical protein
MRDNSAVKRAALNLETWGRALPVIAELDRRGIPLIVLKSLPQVEELYGGAGGRRTVDVDLLVPGDRVEESVQLLSGLGWRLYEQVLFDALRSRPDARARVQRRPWHFAHPDGASTVDLHSDAMDPWFKPMLDPAVWERAVPASRDGIRFLTLAPEDRLLLLCYQLVVDGVPEGKLGDIQRILQGGAELDWTYLRRRAQATGVTIYLRLACELAARHDDRPLAPGWREVPIASTWRYSVLRRLFGTSAAERSDRRNTIMWLLGSDRLGESLPLWRSTFLPSRIDVAADHLGRWPSWREYFGTLARLYWNRIRDRS